MDINENKYLDLENSVSEEISPYNKNYPIIFLSNSIKTSLTQAQTVVNKLYETFVQEIPALSQIEQSLEKGCRYVVDINESTIDSIDKGKIKLSTNKYGEMVAQIRKNNGHYGSKLPIKKELFSKGIDPVQMSNAIQMKALQSQVKMISDQINVIDQSVREILQGQQNDRIALYYSGMSLYLESKNISDNEMKKALIVQSLKTLSEATFQLILTMKSGIQYLASEKYKSEKGKNVELIDKRMKSINESFVFIHQATMLRAGIYCEEGELSAMANVLDEYSHFISKTVTNNADLLAQCDVSDDGTEDGLWKSRKRLKLDVSDLTKQFKMPEKTVYIGISKEDENGKSKGMY